MLTRSWNSTSSPYRSESVRISSGGNSKGGQYIMIQVRLSEMDSRIGFNAPDNPYTPSFPHIQPIHIHSTSPYQRLPLHNTTPLSHSAAVSLSPSLSLSLSLSLLLSLPPSLSLSLLLSLPLSLSILFVCVCCVCRRFHCGPDPQGS